MSIPPDSRVVVHKCECEKPLGFEGCLLQAKARDAGRRNVLKVKVLPEQDGYMEIDMNWFKRIKALKEAAFWKVVAVYLYARNSLNDFIAWLQKR